MLREPEAEYGNIDWPEWHVVKAVYRSPLVVLNLTPNPNRNPLTVRD